MERQAMLHFVCSSAEKAADYARSIADGFTLVPSGCRLKENGVRGHILETIETFAHEGVYIEVGRVRLLDALEVFSAGQVGPLMLM